MAWIYVSLSQPVITSTIHNHSKFQPLRGILAAFPEYAKFWDKQQKVLLWAWDWLENERRAAACIVDMSSTAQTVPRERDDIGKSLLSA